MKAQSLSIQVIVVAVLCLVILAILIFVFSDTLGDFEDDAGACGLKSGVCALECKPSQIQLSAECPNKDGKTQVCCGSFQNDNG